MEKHVVIAGRRFHAVLGFETNTRYMQGTALNCVRPRRESCRLEVILLMMKWRMLR